MNDAATTAKPRRKPLMSRIPAGFVQAVLKGHSGLGIAFAAALYVVCLSGTLVVFYDEFLRWENPAAPQVTEVSPELAQSAIAGAVEAAGGNAEHVYLMMPEADRPFLRVNVDAGEYSEWVAGPDGTIAGQLRSGWSTFLVRLHLYLHLPSAWGIFIVGMTGVALLSSLFSGILAHPRIFRDAFHLRVGGSKRLQEADLHNRIGVWGLPFHMVISLTGAFLGLVTVTVGVLGMAMFKGDTNRIYDLFVAQEPADNPAPAEFLDVRPFFSQLPEEGRLVRIILEHPAEQGAAALFELEDEGVLAGGSQYAFNRAGELYYSKHHDDFTLGEKVLNSLGPLHFGWFGGIIVKIAYGLLGLGLTYLAVGGVNIWLARRRDKGRPAPGWERIWAAVVWGQPAALAAAALAAVAWPAVEPRQLVPLWGAAVLGFLGAALVRVPADALARAGRLVTAGLLAGCVLAHVVARGGWGGDSAVWLVNLAALCAAALLVGVQRLLAVPRDDRRAR